LFVLKKQNKEFKIKISIYAVVGMGVNSKQTLLLFYFLPFITFQILKHKTTK